MKIIHLLLIISVTMNLLNPAFAGLNASNNDVQNTIIDHHDNHQHDDLYKDHVSHDHDDCIHDYCNSTNHCCSSPSLFMLNSLTHDFPYQKDGILSRETGMLLSDFIFSLYRPPKLTT